MISDSGEEQFMSKSKHSEAQTIAALRLAREKRYSYRRLQVLAAREGKRVNHKRLYRIYREAGLCLKRKKRKHCVRSDRQGWR
jgi:putative transposase